MSVSRSLMGLVAAATVVSLVAAPATAAPSYDGKPVAQGAGWLSSQLTKNLVHNDQYQFDDYGLSVDVALGLDAAGKKETLVRQITKAVAKNVAFYTSGGPLDTYAGATAKALVLAVERDKNPRSFGGTNLVSQLEGRVATAAPIAGRIQDAYDPSSAFGGDFANVIGQAYAAAGLSAVKSPRAASVVSFLLQQQCGKGFFRLNFTKSTSAADQSCGGAPKSQRAADTDATAIAVLALLDVKGAKAKAAVKRAVGWLGGKQLMNGSFGGGTSTETPNTNSTGLAGWALGEVGSTKRAARAAAWVRTLQVGGVNPCMGKLTKATGAIAYDYDAFDAGEAKGIKKKTSDQWRRASAQALPVLRWAHKAAAAFSATGPSSAAAGSVVTIRLTGVAPGQRVCVLNGSKDVEYVPGRAPVGKVTVDAPAAGTVGHYAVYVGSKRRDVTIRAAG